MIEQVIRWILCSSLGLCLAACNPSTDMCRTGNRLTVERDDLRAELTRALQAEGIAYQKGEGGEICFAPKQNSHVQSLVIKLESELRPSNQITIADGEFGRHVLKKLSNEGVQYAYTNKGNKLILVITRPGDVKKAKEVIDQVSHAFFDYGTK